MFDEEDVDVSPRKSSRKQSDSKMAPKMSSGNFQSEVEDSARGVDDNMQRAGYNGDPSPSQVMQGHVNN